jgi:outer membrane lipoprotein-sorting protein
MKKISLIILTIIIGYSLASLASAVDVKELLRRSDDLMRGESSYSEIEMKVVTPRWQRTVKMKSWSQGTKKSFIKITYPKRDKGVTFLKIGNEMWQYIPKVERVIKIPPSMMLQSWMGSDLSNDDLVKESSIVEDYAAKLLSEDKTTYEIELLPKPDAAVAWGKVVYRLDKKNYLPVKVYFYDEDNILVRKMIYSDVQEVSKGRYLPMHWLMEPTTEDKEGHQTIIVMKKAVFNSRVDKKIFSLRSLKSMSK